MRKMNKSFCEQRNTVESMTGICAADRCTCKYDPCECDVFGQSNSNYFRTVHNQTQSAFSINVRHT